MLEPDLVKSQFVDPVGRRFLHGWIAGWKSASSLHRVKLEIDRARRYERPLSVIVLEVPTSVEADLERAILHSSPFESLRTTDVVVRISGKKLLYALTLPECRADEARIVGSRVSSQFPAGANDIPVPFGVAEFQRDGFVLEDLVERARSRILQPHVEPIEMGGGRFSKAVKRALDLTVCIALLPFFLVFMPLVGAAVWLDTRGPILFRQTRTGHRGRKFTMYKFRTMHQNADAMKQDLDQANALSHLDSKTQRDPRVTRVGGFLRRTSLDELPQIFSVLKGDMTLVGPRPTSFGPETYDVWHTARLEAVPGITGLWQVSGRGELDFDERLRLDIKYVRNMSLALDLWILARTLPAVLGGRGAY